MSVKPRRLRPYQSQAVKAWHRDVERGKTRSAVVLPTGTGKTDVGAGVIVPWAQERGPGSVLVTAHRDELLNQVTERIAQHDPMLPVGRWQAGRKDRDRHITVASIQTLWQAGGWEKFETFNGRPGMILVDECFPAGTLVGGVPIESIRTGDYVDSWDEVTTQPVRRRVTATMRSRPSSLVKVRTDRGDVICTPGHPFLTTGGWVSASKLSRGAQVVSFAHDDASLFYMRDGVRDDLESEMATEQDRRGVLLDELRKNGAWTSDGGALRGAGVGSVRRVRGLRQQWTSRKRVYCSPMCRDARRSRESSERMARTNRRHASARMKARNPMREPEARAKMAATLREIKHAPRVRGGNGTPLPAGQRALADLLGWPTEETYRTETGEPPWHYKLDIAHPAMKVCVEVDGGSHYSISRQEADARRDALLRSRGWLVFRFSNRAAMERTADCAREVLSTTSKWRVRTPTG
jgi:hypothetical protein